MVFSSITFLYFFLPAVLAIYFIVPKPAKNSVIFISSLFFYAWGEKLLALLFLGSILLGWIFGLLIQKFHSKKISTFFLVLSIVIDLGILVYFKYTDFFISTVNSVLKTNIPLLKITLPIGISFYLFQLLSYEIDVYRGTVQAQKNFINFGTYVAMFPQLIAGPIVRYQDIQHQLNNRVHNFAKTYQGISRFVVGLCKKIIIANSLGELTDLFKNTAELSVLYYWLYAVSFSLQIYYDFSGYSDMAIGLGKIFGFDFNENFDHPYISKSITEFWRRWHISLGSWFRDYVYVPMGGNRKGLARQILNIFTVWTLTGLWHGASWNFVLWGLLFAILLTLEKIFLKKILDRVPVVGHFYTMIFVILGFVLFNASSLNETIDNISGLLAFSKLPFANSESVYYLKSYGLVILAGIFFSTPVFRILYSRIKTSKLGPATAVLEPIVLLALLILSTTFLVDGSFNPFLYFRF